VLSHSGVLAVTLAGVVVGNTRSPVERDLREFKDQLTVMLIGLLFVLLAADVRFAQVQALGWGGLAVVATLVLVVRPLGVWLCTLGSDLDRGERLFIAWVAPRGIVAAAIASLVAADLERSGIAGGIELRALVFLTIAVTVTLAGLTAGPVGTLLGVRLRERDTVAILTTGMLGLALGEELRRGGVPVVFLDSNPGGARRAQEAGFAVVFGDAIQEKIMSRARMSFVRTVVALTSNKTLNSVFVARARDLFGVPNGLVATSETGVGLVSEQVESGTAKIVFDGPHDVERWDSRGRRGDVGVEYFQFSEADRQEPEETAATHSGGLNERFVILSNVRGGKTRVMDSKLTFQDGDQIAVVIHLPEREDAIRELSKGGWTQIELPEGDAVEEGSALAEADDERGDSTGLSRG
jgi:hypothetical protein